MPTVKRIVCLANSEKIGGRCVAGKVLGDNSWIRPVSERESQELSTSERQYADRAEPSLGDVMDIQVLKRTPGKHQPENWLLDASRRWQRVGQLTVRELEPHVETPTTLWSNGSSTNDGRNDRIAETEGVEQSLFLVRVPKLEVDSLVNPFNGRKRLRGDFQLNGTAYRLWVTDPVLRAEFRSRDGRYAVGPALLTISLASRTAAIATS